MVTPDDKSAARQQARQVRRALHADHGDCADKIADQFFTRFPDRRIAITGYWPVGSEASVMAILRQVAEGGGQAALPVIVNEGAPLAFAPWRAGDAMIDGPHGILAPANPPVDDFQADILLVPLLAFDRRGHRLGQGGGYYDRTIALMRRNTNMQVIGVAYDGQGVDALPSEAHDQVLDMVVTEQRVIEF